MNQKIEGCASKLYLDGPIDGQGETPKGALWMVAPASPESLSPSFDPDPVIP